MFDRFTDRARKAMGFMREEAMELGCDHIGSVHLLLGLTREKAGVHHILLTNFELTHDAVWKRVVESFGVRKLKFLGQLPFTPNAKRALEMAMEEAATLGHNYIGTEHLLLGLLRVENSKAVELIESLDGDPREIRKVGYELLGAEVPEEDTGDEEVHFRKLSLLQEIFETALNEANKLGEEYPKAEHVLLALLRHDDPELQRIFKELDVTYDEVVLRILKKL